MLEIKNLAVDLEEEEKSILKGVDLTIEPGKVHAIMGPNGSGRSTLSYVLAGREGYEVTGGSVQFDGKDLLDLETDERAHAGIFLAFQYPVEIPGVGNMEFLKAAVDSVREQREEPPIDSVTFMKRAREACKHASLPVEFLKRGVNEGFSGGEKKRNELIQMILLEPRLCVLDETDSGLDIDALQVVANGVNSMRGEERSFVLVTHYQRLLNYIEPDYVHVLAGGRIVRSGGKELALRLEDEGYAWLEDEVA